MTPQGPTEPKLKPTQPVCEYCNRYRSAGSHAKCSRLRQAKFAQLQGKRK